MRIAHLDLALTAAVAALLCGLVLAGTAAAMRHGVDPGTARNLASFGMAGIGITALRKHIR